jgi:hypothetical protein
MDARDHSAQPAAASAKVTASSAPYVTRPTRWTTFTRTFVPWQLWRFARINQKMFQIIRSSRTGPRRATERDRTRKPHGT